MVRPSLSTLEVVWRHMLAMYGNAWASQYGERPAGVTARTWAAILSGLSDHQVSLGLKSCMSKGAKFPPTAPEFRAKCFGIPELAEVRRDMRKPSPFGRLVWSFLDSYAYGHASTRDADRLLREAYQLACQHVLRGGELPAENQAQISQAPAVYEPASPDVVRRHLLTISAMLGYPMEGEHPPEERGSDTTLRRKDLETRPNP